jgi:hypothetical protein
VQFFYVMCTTIPEVTLVSRAQWHIFMIIIKSSVIKMYDVLSNQNSLYYWNLVIYVYVVILLYSLYSSSMFLSFWKFYLYCMYMYSFLSLVGLKLANQNILFYSILFYSIHTTFSYLSCKKFTRSCNSKLGWWEYSINLKFSPWCYKICVWKSTYCFYWDLLF